jgi:murein DD-endopeptidase MepM/ murein hydrolase activator NlpD
VVAPVIDPFRAPACAQCAGNRGLEYATSPGTPVAAVASGTVSFSGVVAGTRYVVVDQDDGYRATYGRLAAATVALGSAVPSGAVVGTTTAAFYFGLRLGETYVDPAPFLGRLRYRPRLVPVDGSPRRAPPPPRLACAAG